STSARRSERLRSVDRWRTDCVDGKTRAARSREISGDQGGVRGTLSQERARICFHGMVARSPARRWFEFGERLDCGGRRLACTKMPTRDEIFDDANGDLAIGELESAVVKYQRCVDVDP